MSVDDRRSQTLRTSAATLPFAVLATDEGDLSSNVRWINHDDQDLLINTTISPPSMQPQNQGVLVSACLLKDHNSFHYVEARGTVTGATFGLSFTSAAEL